MSPLTKASASLAVSARPASSRARASRQPPTIPATAPTFTAVSSGKSGSATVRPSATRTREVTPIVPPQTTATATHHTATTHRPVRDSSEFETRYPG